jgi:hypothetical protein
MSKVLERKLQLYAHHCGADCVWLADALKSVRAVQAHADIAGEGDDLRTVYVLLTGWGARRKYLPDGRRQITSHEVGPDT